jgi:cobalt-zinc-cadmium efflux system membrane fusion protein
VLNTIPSLVVFLLLGGVLYFGHHTGWKLPKASTSFGSGEAPEKSADWCAEHLVPESQCFVCHPELEGKFSAQYEAKYGKKPPKPERS